MNTQGYQNILVALFLSDNARKVFNNIMKLPVAIKFLLSGLMAPDEAEAALRKEQTSLYGGQAVIEGVMMKGPERTVVACRKPDGKIVKKVLREGVDEKKKNFWYKTPFLRGLLILVDSMSLGYKALMYSGQVADPDESPRNPFIESIAMILGLLIALLLFKFLPILITKGIFMLFGIDFDRETMPIGISVFFSLIEGIIKAGILVGYMLSIRFLKEIRRVFQYHGSEHKTINAYEAGSDLSIDDIEKYPTFHPRCGTSFLFSIVLFSLLVAMTFPLITMWLTGNPNLAFTNYAVRFGLHILFLPMIASIGYEFIRFTARFDDKHPFIKILTWPGKLLQKVTALEPDRDMLEVACTSLHLAMGTIPADQVPDWTPGRAENSEDTESEGDLNPEPD